MRLDSYILSVCGELDQAGRHVEAEYLERVVAAQSQEAQAPAQQPAQQQPAAADPQLEALLQQVQRQASQAAKAFEDAEQFLQTVYDEGRPTRTTIMKGNMDFRRFVREKTRGGFAQQQPSNPYAPAPRVAQTQPAQPQQPAPPAAPRGGVPVQQPTAQGQFQQQAPVPDDAQEFIEWLEMKYSGGSQSGFGGGGLPFSLGG